MIVFIQYIKSPHIQRPDIFYRYQNRENYTGLETGIFCDEHYLTDFPVSKK